MSQPYVGEIRMFAGNFAPENWLLCQGQTINIAEYEVLFQLIGTTYGGDGQNNFALPNLQSRLAIHQGSDSQGNAYAIGSTGGTEQVTLTSNQLPSHNHPMVANATAGSGASSNGTGAVFGALGTADTVYGDGTAGTTALSPKAIGTFNQGNQPHSNIKPFLCINFIIAMNGIYPSQS